MVEDEVRALRKRVFDLERDLERYHYRLEGSLDHDRSRLFHTAWSIYDLLYLFLAFYGTHLISEWLVLDGILNWVVTGAIFFALLVIVFGYVEHSKTKALKGLSSLPDWDEQRTKD